jgi:hypothetical protein
MAPEEGLLLFVADLEGGRLTGTFCREASYSDCITPASLSPADPMTIVRIPAARSCLMEVAYELGRAVAGAHESQPANADCIDIQPGVLNYPGHLVFRAPVGRPTQVSYWESREDAAREVIALRYPLLGDVELASSPMCRGVSH